MPSLKQGFKPFRERAEQLRQEIYLQNLLIQNCMHKEEEVHGIPMMHFFERREGGFQPCISQVVDNLNAELERLIKALNSGKYSLVTESLQTLLCQKGKFLDSISAYRALFECLSERYETGTAERAGTPLQDSILESMINRNCAFITKCTSTPFEQVGESAREEFSDYAMRMKKVYDFDLEGFMQKYIHLLEEIRKTISSSRTSALNVEFSRPIPSLSKFIPAKKPLKTPDEEKYRAAEQSKLRLKHAIAKQADWKDLGQIIANYYSENRSVDDAELLTVRANMFYGVYLAPKPMRKKIRFEELIGYEEQKQQLIQNTEGLLKGKANNVFITGPQGTGKSSMINALLTKYADKGLRVIEIPKDSAPYLPHVFDAIQARQEYKFIILIDEFKAGEDEHFYEHMKKVIEGSFDGLPSNARMYVISNHEDNLRAGFNGNSGDRSLEDRFGLVVKFDNPDKATIKQIMQHYVSKNKINMKEEEVQERFDKYCSDRKITTPNPRNIRDFVTTLAA